MTYVVNVHVYEMKKCYKTSLTNANIVHYTYDKGLLLLFKDIFVNLNS